MRKPSLSVRQIFEIARRRSAGEQTKEVARALGCTPDQVTHYWRTSALYKPGSDVVRRRRQQALRRLNEQRVKHRMTAELRAAAACLRAEIAAARREAVALSARRELYRGGWP